MSALTPASRLKAARAVRQTMEEARFEAITSDWSVADRESLRSVWAASVIAETIAEQQARNARSVA